MYVQEMLGPELDLEMRQYVRDGAHYVPTVTQVAYEEQQWADQTEGSYTDQSEARKISCELSWKYKVISIGDLFIVKLCFWFIEKSIYCQFAISD